MDGESDMYMGTATIMTGLERTAAKAAEDVLFPGLAGCEDMDRKLAQVASAEIKDIPQTLLEDVFQCIEFIQVLSLRRDASYLLNLEPVSNAVISNGSDSVQTEVECDTAYDCSLIARCLVIRHFRLSRHTCADMLYGPKFNGKKRPCGAYSRCFRVCPTWYSIISNDLAPFCRNVVFQLPKVGITSAEERELPYHTAANDHMWKEIQETAELTRLKTNYWQFAKRANTVVFLQKKQLPPDTSEYMRYLCGRPMYTNTIVLDSYEQQVAVDQRADRLKKIVYANMRVHSNFFFHPTVCHPGFQTVASQITLHVEPRELSAEVPYEMTLCLCANWAIPIEITGGTQFVLSTEEAEIVRAEEAAGRSVSSRQYNPVAVYFVEQNVAQLTEDQIAKFHARHGKDNYSELMLLLNKKLSSRYPSDSNPSAEDRIRNLDARGFVAAAHPMTAFLVRHAVERFLRAYNIWEDEDYAIHEQLRKRFARHERFGL